MEPRQGHMVPTGEDIMVKSLYAVYMAGAYICEVSASFTEELALLCFGYDLYPV